MANVIYTQHQKEERRSRENLIFNVIGLGEKLDRFVVDKGHKNGKEIHTLTTTGIIVIQNLNTKKVVTMLIARPGQVERYYIDEHKYINDDVKKVINIAREHQKLGYNRM